VEAVVCVPTFRRPEHLRLTLASLAAQRTARRFAVVVAEDDASGGEGAAVAASVFEAGDLGGVCVVEPEQGNCSAINAAFGEALRRYPLAGAILMMDDDEIASPDWLEGMLAAAEETGADLVGGPVHPRMAPGVRRSLARHPAFRPAFDRSGPVPIIYGTGNCLIRRRVFERFPEPRLDPRFNFLGGGDADFFTRCREAGFRFHWAAEAAITETVPPERTRLSWLVARGLRIGAVNYRVERKRVRSGWGMARIVAKNLATLPVSLLRGVGALIRSREPSAFLHPPLVALGRSLAALGIEPQQYRERRSR
jgi:GT2 family glycosyltransferase